MQPTGTQQVTAQPSVERDALASIFTPHLRQAQAPVTAESASTTTADVVTATPPAVAASQTEPATAETPAEPIAETPVMTTTKTPVVDTTLESLIDTMTSTSGAVASWTPEAVEAFKTTFGVDDPSTYKTSVEAKLQEAELLRKEYEVSKPLIEQINSLPPSILEPLKLAMQGKHKEAQSYIATTPEVVLANKDASKCSDRELIDSYFPGKVSADQWAKAEDPETDPDVVDAYKERIKVLREAAEEKHTRNLESLRSKQENERQERQRAEEAYRNNVAATITHLNSTPFKSLADATTQDDIASGKYISRYMNPDGSPTVESATLHVKALNFDKAVAVAHARGLKQGRDQALLEATSRQPAAVGTQRRTSGDAVQNQTDEGRLRMLTFASLTAKT